MAIPGEVAGYRQAREETLALTGALSQAQLDYRPGPRRWSVGEVLDHLARVDAMYRREIELLVELALAGRRPHLKRGLADIDVSFFSVPKRWLRAAEPLLNAMGRFMSPKMVAKIAANRRVFIQNPGAATPRHGRPAAELRRDARDSLAAFERVFAAHPELDYAAMVHQHPIFGRNTVPGLLAFSIGHERRHQAQIRDVLADPGFPPA